MKRLGVVPLIILGEITILISLFSSALGVSWLCAGLLFLLFNRSAKGFPGKGSLSKIAFVAVIAVFSAGCTVKVPMNPYVGKIGINHELPVEAGLLITEATKGYVFKGNPESFTAGGRPHEFPLGEALENASLQTFSQVFQKVSVVRTREEAKNYQIVIEPKIEEFHFEYDALSYVGFAVAVLSKMKVGVTLANGETKIWEKIVESPQQKEGPWVLNIDYEKDAGLAASKALVFALRNIAEAIAADGSIRQFIEQRRQAPTPEGKGP